MAWAARREANEQVLESARRTWVLSRVPDARRDANLAWAQVRARIRAQAGPAVAWQRTNGPPTWSGRTRWPVHPAIAAGIVGIVGLAVAGIFWKSVGLGAGAGQIAVHEVITRKGEHARVRLSDASEVVLAPESRLKLSGGFGTTRRDVTLSGEAYFSVTPNPLRPFSVHAGRSVTEVLGTEFNVRAYPGDASVRVVVAEGTVSLAAAGREADAAKVLHPGELGEVKPGQEEVVIRPADLTRDLAWRDGRLTFHETPLGEVAREIERWYGVPIQIADSTLAARRVTASFRHQPVEEVAMVIAASLGLECVRIGEAYVFRLKEKAHALATR